MSELFRRCPECGGSGIAPDFGELPPPRGTCDTCAGEGSVPVDLAALRERLALEIAKAHAIRSLGKTGPPSADDYRSYADAVLAVLTGEDRPASGGGG